MYLRVGWRKLAVDGYLIIRGTISSGTYVDPFVLIFTSTLCSVDFSRDSDGAIAELVSPLFPTESVDLDALKELSSPL